jgi:hypothetical protein
MKRIDLIKRITEMNCALIRHGAKQDWHQNPRTKISQPIPRHKEIKESLTKTHY